MVFFVDYSNGFSWCLRRASSSWEVFMLVRTMLTETLHPDEQICLLHQVLPLFCLVSRHSRKNNIRQSFVCGCVCNCPYKHRMNLKDSAGPADNSLCWTTDKALSFFIEVFFFKKKSVHSLITFAQLLHLDLSFIASPNVPH